jgi:hypothetical protein
MSHDDLERRLRSERGSRELGYVPGDVEPALDASSARRHGLRPLRVAGSLAVVAAGVVLTLAVIGVIGRGGDGEGFGVGSGPGATSPLPSVAPTAARPGICTPGDILLRPEPWGGAAGSRGTSVAVSLTEGAAACELPIDVTARILDGSGAELVAGASGGTGSVTLDPAASYRVSVSWSNWCDAAPQPWLRWDLRFVSGDWIDVVEEQSTSRPSTEPALPVPPCLGEGGSHLSVTPVQPGP